MGTRGAFGVRIEGEDKITYNHWDSYPDGLGKWTIEALHEMLKDEEKLHREAKALKAVGSKPPTKKQIEQLKKFANTGVDDGKLSNWYVLLRETQGDLQKILEAGYFDDASGSLADSLFTEWAYIVNFDESVLEIYKGFQTKPHTEGRYASMPVETEEGRTTYYPVAFVNVIPFDVIKGSAEVAVEVLLKMTKEDDEDEDEAEVTVSV